MTQTFGFSTASFLHHPPAVAVREIRKVGFDCVVIRLDAKALNPFDSALFEMQVGRLQEAVADARVLIDADAPFLLDLVKAELPYFSTFENVGADLRMELIQRGVQLSQRLGGGDLVFSIGPIDEACGLEATLETVAPRIGRLLEFAGAADVQLSVRPGAGDLVNSIADFERLLQWLDDSEGLRLAADVGHMAIQGELPAVPLLQRMAGRVSSVTVATDKDLDVYRLCQELQVSLSEVPVILKSETAESPVESARMAMLLVKGSFL